jgi:uncharacterized protein (TIGR02466 family)
MTHIMTVAEENQPESNIIISAGEVDLHERVLFTQNIYEGMLTPSPDIAEHILDHSKKEKGVRISNRGDSWQSKAYGINDHPLLRPYIMSIAEQVKDLYKHYGIDKDLEWQDIQYWININRKGATNMLHQHPGAIFSGVWYVQSEIGNGDLVIQRENLSFIQQNNPNPVNERVCSSFSISSQTGKVVLFPSTTPHAVDENMLDSDRISIAINFR